MKHRDLMAPDTEPTDEELALVVREAREAAQARRARADAWIAARLDEANGGCSSASPKAGAMTAGGELQSRPRLLVVAGPNGSGKTTITEHGSEAASTSTPT